jgi:hypothetical protein
MAKKIHKLTPPSGEVAPLSMAANYGVAKEQSVKEFLDDQIQECRKRTEALCILKAKAETAGILDMPHGFLRDIANGYVYF